MSALLLGGIVQSVGKIIDDLHTSDKERMDAQLEVAKIEAGLKQGQIDVNKAEAQHQSVFVSGWRPFIGWVCGCGFVYQYVVRPMLPWVLTVAGINDVPPLPALDGSLMELTVGMLGLGALRTFEKTKGVAG
jgi:hypothetical protein